MCQRGRPASFQVYTVRRRQCILPNRADILALTFLLAGQLLLQTTFARKLFNERFWHNLVTAVYDFRISLRGAPGFKKLNTLFLRIITFDQDYREIISDLLQRNSSCSSFIAIFLDTIYFVTST